MTPLKKLANSVSTGGLTSSLLDSAFGIIKAKKSNLADIQLLVNNIADYAFFHKERMSSALKLGVLNFYINTFKLTLNSSSDLDLIQIISTELGLYPPESKTFALSQVESFLVPFISALDDSAKTDANTLKATLTLGAMVMSSKCWVRGVEQFGTLVRQKKLLRYPLSLLKNFLCAPKPVPESSIILNSLLTFLAKYNASSCIRP